MPLHKIPTQQHILDFYARSTSKEMTSAGRHAGSLRALPQGIDDLMQVVQGVCVHEYAAEPFYGFTVPETRKSESHIRPLEKRIDRLLEIDASPMTSARPVEKRLVGVCHQFVLLLTGILRQHGIPARSRRGFGGYFNKGYFEDHVVCEYWHAGEERWKRADPQFDDEWRTRLKIAHDVLDVPRDQFLTAADAWMACRAQKADAAKFGIFTDDMRGLWFIAAALVSEVAGLNRMELLPWDSWGAMPQPRQSLDGFQLGLFDGLAELTRDPDAAFDDLRARYDNDDRLRVPDTVFNAVLNRPQSIWT